MAKKTKNVGEIADQSQDFSSELITALNKEFGIRVAYNLSNTESPTHVKRWVSTGSTLLDYAIANRPNGGVPEGRIIEVFGEPSTGKSHIAFAVAATVQSMGGFVIYIDTENATPVEKLANMGIDVSKRFIYCDTHCTEEVFKIVERAIEIASGVIAKRDVPILVVWDSVAATSPKAELDGNYDDNTMGLQARVISKALRKITGIIGQNNVIFMCLNQVRMKIGVMFGDPTTTPGGKAIPFHASVRMGLTGGSPVKDSEGNVIGIRTHVTIKKNKVAPPHRKVEFDILFGKGISEAESILDLLRAKSKKSPLTIGDHKYEITDAGAWKNFTVYDADGVAIIEHKFQKASFEDMLKNPEFKPHLDKMLEHVLVVDTGQANVLADDN